MGAATVTRDLNKLTEGPHVHRNLSTPQLVEAAIARGEASLASNGALVALTGARTGRSPRDKFIVEDAETKDRVDWGKVNQPFPPEKFQALLDRVVAAHGGARSLCHGSLRRRGPDVPAAHPDHLRICVACAVREAALRAAGAGGACRSRRRNSPSSRRRSSKRFLSGTARGRDVHPHRLHAQDDPDRRHQIRGRDEEVDLRRDELPAARARCLSRCTARPTSARKARRRCSSASPEPARRRSPPIRCAV